MPTGKPNFNLNSYGVKYLSKEEVQEFLEKQTKVYNYEPPTGQDQAALRSERAKKPKGTLQASESAKKLISEVKPAEATPEPKVTRNSKFVFNDPKYGVPDTRKRQTTGHGESGVVSPNTTALDTRTSTGTAIGNKGGREGGVGNAPEELTGSDVTSSKQGNRNVAVGVGEKGKEVFDKKEGVGEKYEKRYHPDGKPITQKQRKEKLQKETEAKEKREKETKLNQALQKLEREKQQKKKIPQKTGKGDKNQDTEDYNPQGDTESNIETESEASFRKRSEENERKRKEAEAKKKKKKLSDDERMTNIVEEYRSGRVLGKSNDIITEMNIMKLDMMNKLDTSPKGMKGQKFVRGSMASAGRKPATKLPNAGGVQDKLEIMRDEAPKETPEKQAKDKKLLETGATGKPSGSVANRYG